MRMMAVKMTLMMLMKWHLMMILVMRSLVKILMKNMMISVPTPKQSKKRPAQQAFVAATKKTKSSTPDKTGFNSFFCFFAVIFTNIWRIFYLEPWVFFYKFVNIFSKLKLSL